MAPEGLDFDVANVRSQASVYCAQLALDCFQPGERLGDGVRGLSVVGLDQLPRFSGELLRSRQIGGGQSVPGCCAQMAVQGPGRADRPFVCRSARGDSVGGGAQRRDLCTRSRVAQAPCRCSGRGGDDVSQRLDVRCRRGVRDFGKGYAAPARPPWRLRAKQQSVP